MATVFDLVVDSADPSCFVFDSALNVEQRYSLDSIDGHWGSRKHSQVQYFDVFTLRSCWKIAVAIIWCVALLNN